MKNLLNFFFSFDKLFKEKLIVPFFWLAIIGRGGYRAAKETWPAGRVKKQDNVYETKDNHINK